MPDAVFGDDSVKTDEDGRKVLFADEVVRADGVQQMKGFGKLPPIAKSGEAFFAVKTRRLGAFGQQSPGAKIEEDYDWTLARGGVASSARAGEDASAARAEGVRGGLG